MLIIYVIRFGDERSYFTGGHYELSNFKKLEFSKVIVYNLLICIKAFLNELYEKRYNSILNYNFGFSYCGPYK